MASVRVLPTTPADWKLESKSLVCKSIHEYGLACSGSGITREQFILLRTLWVKRSKYQLYGSDRSNWMDNSSFKAAQAFLSSSTIAPTWKQFLKSTGMHPSDLEQQGYDGLHTFSLVRYHQAQSQGLSSEENNSAKVDMSPIAKRTRNRLKQRIAAQSSPTPGPKLTGLEQDLGVLDITDPPPSQPPTTPDRGGSNVLPMTATPTPGDFSSPFEDPGIFKAIQDEQIVNTALIEYLNALAIHCKDLKANWTLHRLPLVTRDNQREKIYEARVDGYLRRRRDGKPLAVIEVKPFTRTRKPDDIRMQESAQMAAWINQYQPSNTDLEGNIKRLLISQDRHQIYLNFAVFDADYVDYICDKQGINYDKNSFLWMYEYGPFDVGNQSDMSMLGELVLGYTLGESR